MMERKDLAMSFTGCDKRMVIQNNCWNPCVGREEYSERKETEMFQASETAQAKGRLVSEERILYSRRFDLREQHEDVF